MKATPRSQNNLQLSTENPDLSAPENGPFLFKERESIGVNSAKPISRSGDNLDLLISTVDLGEENLNKRSQIIRPSGETKRVKAYPSGEEINTTREDPTAIVETNLDAGGIAITCPTES